MKHILRILSVSLIAALVSCSACSKSDGTSPRAAGISAAITSEQETTAITASAGTVATAAAATTAATEPETYSAQYKLVQHILNECAKLKSPCRPFCISNGRLPAGH